MSNLSRLSNQGLPDDANSPLASLDIKSINFPNERYKKFAEILQKLCVLEESLETKHRLLETAGVSADTSANKAKLEIEELKKSMHDLLLKKHSYPNGVRLVITKDDAAAYGHEYRYGKYDFRDSDAQNLASFLEIIACFQYELEGHYMNRGGYEEGERQAMIKDTTYHLLSNIDHMMKILTGYFKD
jgi:hypothetical protein